MIREKYKKNKTTGDKEKPARRIRRDATRCDSTLARASLSLSTTTTTTIITTTTATTTTTRDDERARGSTMTTMMMPPREGSGVRDARRRRSARAATTTTTTTTTVMLALVASVFAPAPARAMSMGSSSTSTFVCTAQCDANAPTTSQCGAGNVTNTAYACSAARTTYEGCSKTVCDEVCANVANPMTAEPTAVTARGNTYHCFNASDYKYMYTSGTASAAEQKAIEHSVAMNCDGSAHDMSSMSMYMSGATHAACSGWSNVVSSARAATTTAAIALALLACAFA